MVLKNNSRERKAAGQRPPAESLDLAPPAGKALWMFWSVEGRPSACIVEVAAAEPEGHFHLSVFRTKADGSAATRVVWISSTPVPTAALADCVDCLLASVDPRPVTLKAPTLVPGPAPSVEHPRRGELVAAEERLRVVLD